MPTENFTTWTETDPNSDITVAASSVTSDTQLRTAMAWVSKDYGADYFDILEHDFDIKCTANDDQADIVNYALQSSAANGYKNTASTDVLVGMSDWGTNEAIVLERRTVIADESVLDWTQNTTYYCTLRRDASVLELDIYSDSGRTSLTETLSITFTNTKWRYATVNMSGYVSTTTNFSAVTSNLDLKELGVALGGTIIGASESDLVTGGKTITLTISGDTVIPAS